MNLQAFATTWLPPEIRESWRAIRGLGLVRRSQATVMLTVSVGAAVFEGFGVAMLLPVFQFLEKGGTREALVASGGISAKLAYLFDLVNLPVTLLPLLLVVFGLLLIRQGLVFTRVVFGAVIAQGMAHELRCLGFRRLVGADTVHLYGRDTGLLVNWLTMEASRVGNIVNALVSLASTFAMFPVYLALLLVLSVKLTLLAGAIMVVVYLVNRTIIRLSRQVGGDVARLNGRLSRFVMERLQGIRTVKVANQEPQEIAWQREISGELKQCYVRLARISGRIEAVVEPMVVAAGLGFLYVSSRALGLGLAQVGLFLFILIRLVPIAKSFFDNRHNVASLTESLLGLERMIEDAAQARSIKAGRQTFSGLQRTIVFEDVRFTYRTEDGPALRDVSLEIPAGQMTALVGPSGAGKSTLVDLLPRLIVPERGRLYFDGRAAEEFDLVSLRRQIAFVGQESYLFNDTVAEAIRYGLPAASDEEVRRAAKLAYADEFIRTFAQGYEQLVGENGANLSGGQRQRIILARGLIRRCSILILDEPTSALDSESEAYIQQAIDDIRATKQVTLVVIAHRLSTVNRADRIVVMGHGQIVATGTHGQLCRDNPWYAQMIRLQHVTAGEDTA